MTVPATDRPLPPFGLFLLLLAALAPAARPAAAADPCAATPAPAAASVRAERLAGPVVLDGVLDDAAWRRPGETRMVQNEPENGCPPRRPTEFWVAYDDEAFYLAARLHDDAPDSIGARLGRRDTWPASDWLFLNLDTFNDDRNAFSFSVNPAGVLGDAKLYNDGWSDDSWDGVWDAAAAVDGAGWNVEIRIPFSQLKFPENAVQVWGINISRRVLRDNARDDLFHKPRGSAGYGSRFPDLVGIRDIAPGTTAELRPYVSGRADFRDVEPGDPFRDDPDLAADAGLDLKTALSSNLTLNAAVNPDFGQVEVDPAVVNLSAYETFYEERRPFFVEDANVFQFGMEGLSSNWNFNWMDPMLFYSRRVGRAPQLGVRGDPEWVESPDLTTILGAAKVSGKVGDTSVGALTAFTAREKARLRTGGVDDEQVVEPFTNYSVVRAKTARPDGSRGLGVMATGTLRDLDDPVSQASLDRRAFTAGVDGWTHLDEERMWAVKAYVAASHVTGSPDAIADLQTSSRRYYQRPDADHLDYDPDRTVLQGWTGRVGLNKQSGNWRFNSAAGYASPGFEINDLGFQYRTDMINTSMVGGYAWHEPHAVFRSQSVYLGTYKSWDTGGTPSTHGAGLFYWNQLANYWSVDGRVFYNPERNDLRLTRGGPAMRAPEFREYGLTLGTDHRKSWQVIAGVAGSSDDGGSAQASGRLTFAWHPLESLGLQVTPRYAWSQDEAQYYDTIDDPGAAATYGSRYVFADLEYRQFSLETRFDWTFTPNLTLQAYVQPLFAVGRYSDHKELARPSSYAFRRYGADPGSAIAYDDAAGEYVVTPDTAAPDDTFRLGDNDFNFKSLRVNMVMRWEYAAGSTFYLVWTQDRVDTHHPGDFDLGRDVRSLLDAPGEHVLMVKVAQYFSL